MAMLSQTVSHRDPLQRLRRLAFLTVLACRERINHKLAEKRAALMLRSLDRRLLEDFGANSFAIRRHPRDTAPTGEPKVGPLVAIYMPYSQVPSRVADVVF